MTTEQSTSRPKPHPPVKKVEPQESSSSTTSSPSPKKPFVRKPHLTERPFQNPELRKFRESMPEPKRNGRKQYNKRSK